MEYKVKTKWDNICKELNAQGYSVIAVLAHYEKENVNFATTIKTVRVDGLPELTTNHIILDAVREISSEWSETAHSENSTE